MDEQWHPIETSPRRSWRELRVGLQLADRRGPVNEEDVERFNRAIADFAATVNAVSQREAPAAAASRAKELDAFCADTDIEVAVNLVSHFGAKFAIARVKSVALDNGLSETASGELVRFTHDGFPGFVIRSLDDPGRSLAITTRASRSRSISAGRRRATNTGRDGPCGRIFAATLGASSWT